MGASFRLDVGTLRPLREMPDGRAIAEGHLTRTGVFEYRNKDGSIRREYRPPEEVFKKDSLESFALVPVTNDHPPEDLTSKNARKYAVGSVGESIRRDDDHVAAPLSIYDSETIEEMKAGKVQLSCGYTADVIESPGVTPEGLEYDAVQRNIRGNHVALVRVARAGSTARVRLDELRMDAAEMVVAEPPTVEVLQARIDSLEKSMEEMRQSKDGQIAALQAALFTKHVSPSTEE